MVLDMELIRAGEGLIMEGLSRNFQYVLDNYNDGSRHVDSTTPLYSVLCVKIPQILRDQLGNRNDIHVKASMGNGNKAFFPWVAILNRNITESTEKGLYVVFLFKKDMSGFYLSLDQGIKNFDKLYHDKKYESAIHVADYFRSQLDGDTSFSMKEISLGGKKGSLGYGYEKTNIISKYYPSNQFSEKMLSDDISEIMSIYDLIIKHMATRSYDTVIHDVLDDESTMYLSGSEAIMEIKESVDPNENLPFGFFRELEEVKPYTDRSHKFKKMTVPKHGKIDYAKKAERDAKAGLIGEELAIYYEQQRLISLGREDLADRIRWISQLSDAYGYDIDSFDIDENGKEYGIKIEVKSSTSQIDTEFFVSKNEVEVSKYYDKIYCVFRIYDVNSQKPKFYRVFGKIEDNFILDPVTFMARYKY